MEVYIMDESLVLNVIAEQLGVPADSLSAETAFADLNADSLELFHFVPFNTLLIPMIITFCAAGMFVGIVGSWTSIRKFMDV